jgi:steroid delta-isomerase-like uncharacterized protein
LAETKTGSNSKAAAEDTAAEKPKAPGRRRITRRKAVETHVRSYFDALAIRDVNAAGEHWSEDAVDEPVPVGPLRGRQEIAGFLRELYAAVPDLETTVGRVVAGEHNAAVEWRMRGTFDGAPFQGIEPTGKAVEMRGVDVFDVEDGLLTACTGYYDGAEFARQAGMLPARDSGAERAMTGAFNAVTKLRRVVNERRGG